MYGDSVFVNFDPLGVIPPGGIGKRELYLVLRRSDAIVVFSSRFDEISRDEVRVFETSPDGLRAISADYSGTVCRWSFDPLSSSCRPAPAPSSMRLGIVPCPDAYAYLVRLRRGTLTVCGTLCGQLTQIL